MGIISGHLKGLFRFTGRENRKQFWLWVLICYVLQMGLGLIVAMPMLVSMFMAFPRLMMPDPSGAPKTPDQVNAELMRTMLPMQSTMVTVSAIISFVFTLLLLAAAVRRLHDGNRTGLWAAPALVLGVVSQIVGVAMASTTVSEMMADPGRSPLAVYGTMGNALLLQGASSIAYILLIVLLVLRGTTGPNRFGPDPLADADPYPPGPYPRA